MIGQPLYAAKKGVTVVLASTATLIEGGQAANIKVSVSCPKRYDVLEAFVYITQDGFTSDFAGIPLQCRNKKVQEHLVRVPASSDASFHLGAATATAYVLLGDGDLSGGDNRAITIQ
jgi:hypothetical protein